MLNFRHGVSVSAKPSFRIIRFSTFELNLQTGELHQQGQKLKLQEQPFQVLAALLERPGEIVTREELRSKLWSVNTFVDFDHSLNAAIKRLRDALGESPEAPIFIETLARRGYRFIAPVNGSAASSIMRNRSFSGPKPIVFLDSPDCHRLPCIDCRRRGTGLGNKAASIAAHKH